MDLRSRSILARWLGDMAGSSVEGGGMTDREMLELAANAVGLKIHARKQAERDAIGCGGAGLWMVDGDSCWNPLDDSGQALQVAVWLHMTVSCYMGNTCAQIGVPGGSSVYVDETDHPDPCSATRRAIVRAAAEVGAGQRRSASPSCARWSSA